MKKSEKQSRVLSFRKCVYKYAMEFGLVDWEIFTESEDHEGSRAVCHFNLESKISTIAYNPNWLFCESVSLSEIERVAFHECAELFLCKITRMLDHYYSEPVVNKEMHTVIRFLENIKFGFTI